MGTDYMGTEPHSFRKINWAPSPNHSEEMKMLNAKTKCDADPEVSGNFFQKRL